MKLYKPYLYAARFFHVSERTQNRVCLVLCTGTVFYIGYHLILAYVVR